MDEDWTKKSEV